MKRFVALTLMVAIMVVTTGAVRTPAQNYCGYDVDADYGGKLLDEPLWEVNFFLDDQLMYSAVAEDSLVDYTIDNISGMIEGYWDESECFYDEQIINVYYGRY